MRTVYLIRHGHPDFPCGAHMCLGRTDTPLGPLGRMQACLLGESLGSLGLSVFSSPLSRCLETAAPFEEAVIPVPELAEQDMGPWDGLDFDTIRREWPELYARRDAEPLLVPPGAETLAEVQARVMLAFQRCVYSCRGDVAVVAHASVIQAILASVGNTPLERSRALRPPYGSCTILRDHGRGLRLAEYAVLPKPELSPTLAEKLLSAAAPGEKVERHCRAVARYAMELYFNIPVEMDDFLLYFASTLHDVARSEHDHARAAALWLRTLLYPEAAAIVERHHDWAGGEIDEAALLFLADKCVREDRLVPLEERFAASRLKCRSEEALAAHERRRRAALELQLRINQLAGRKLVK